MTDYLIALTVFFTTIIIFFILILRIKYIMAVNREIIINNDENNNTIIDIIYENNNSPIDIIYEKTEYCLICIENNSNVILIPCNHYIICYNCMCNLHLYNQYKCPLCRSDIISYRRIMVNHIEPIIIQR